MSYLQCADGLPAFSRAVISLWFRVPASTLGNVSFGSPTGPLTGVIPLLTFGKTQQKITYDVVAVDNTVAVGVDHPTQPILQFEATNPRAGFHIPSYIGLVPSNATSGNLRLVAQVQMADYAIQANVGLWADTIEDWSNFDPDVPPNPGVGDGIFSNAGHTYVVPSLRDVSNDDPVRPEYFWIDAMPFNLAPDRWHHLLLSLDVGQNCDTEGAAYLGSHADTDEGTSSHCRIWIALDDINYNGANLGPYQVDGGDLNGILTANAWGVANSIAVLVFDHIPGAATCTYAPDPIPSGADPFGIPSTSLFVDDVHQVEMAELQIFTGVVLDTGITDNRRAFIDDDGKPAKMSAAETLLGKKAEIKLHGSGNWKRGRNTGSIGLGDDGTTIEAGQFVPTAIIKQYKPDPSLHGPQSPLGV